MAERLAKSALVLFVLPHSFFATTEIAEKCGDESGETKMQAGIEVEIYVYIQRSLISA